MPTKDSLKLPYARPLMEVYDVFRTHSKRHFKQFITVDLDVTQIWADIRLRCNILLLITILIDKV